MKRYAEVLLFLILFLNLAACSSEERLEVKMSPGNSALIRGGADVLPDDPIGKATVFILKFDSSNKTSGIGVCSGVAISKTIVVTAAHCLAGGKDSKAPLPSTMNLFIFPTLKFDWNVFTMKMLTQDYSYAATPDLTRVHPKYRGFRGGGFSTDYEINDIGLIRVLPLPDSVVPAKLLTDRSLIKKRLKVVAAGFGPTEQDQKDDIQVLRKLETHTVSGIGSVTGQVLLYETRSNELVPGDSGGPSFTVVDGEFYLWAVRSNGGVGEPGRVEPTVRHLEWIAKASAELEASPIKNPRYVIAEPTPAPTPIAAENPAPESSLAGQ